jgi:hypothetical protein
MSVQLKSTLDIEAAAESFAVTHTQVQKDGVDQVHGVNSLWCDVPKAGVRCPKNSRLCRRDIENMNSPKIQPYTKGHGHGIKTTQDRSTVLLKTWQQAWFCECYPKS